jgi:hypothetical protein
MLHDMLALPFDEIARIVGRSPTAARQLASRARRRVQGAATANGADLARKREVVNAFLSALRGGDFEGLLAVLDPDLVVRAGAAEVRGARNWAKQAISFSRAARFARPALVNGTVGAVLAPRGRLFRVLCFTLARGKIAGIEVVGDPARLRELDLAVLDATTDPT